MVCPPMRCVQSSLSPSKSTPTFAQEQNAIKDLHKHDLVRSIKTHKNIPGKALQRADAYYEPEPTLSAHPAKREESLHSRAQDRLTTIRQTPQKLHNGPCTLRIKSRRRLIQKQQKPRLRKRTLSKFNAYSTGTPTLAASSTPIVVRFLSSTPRVPTMASAYASKPHIFKQRSALAECRMRDTAMHKRRGRTH
jgi:hypothetical protein